MSNNYKLPELHKYREWNSSERMAIHQMLISYVRENNLCNIIMPNEAAPYNLVKLISISFENEAAAIWVHFETITAERLTLPIDFISRIEISGQKEI